MVQSQRREHSQGRMEVGVERTPRQSTAFYWVDKTDKQAHWIGSKSKQVPMGEWGSSCSNSLGDGQ